MIKPNEDPKPSILEHPISIEDIIARSIDIEYRRSNSDEVQKWLIDFYMDTNVYVFLSPKNLDTISEGVFSGFTADVNKAFDYSIRDFVLNLTLQIAVSLSQDYLEELIERIVTAYKALRVETMFDHRYAPASVMDGLKFDATDLKNTLKSEKWILTLVSILFFFDRTETYKTVINLFMNHKGVGNA